MEAIADCGRWQIHYTVQGEGDPLILLHGGAPASSGASSFAKNIPQLAREFRTYAIDFPGWGQSSRHLTLPGKFENPMEVGAEVVAAFMQALGIRRAHLLGGSFGGAAALLTALKFPELVDHLVLVAPAGGDTKGKLTPGVLKLLTYYSGEGATLDKLRALMGDMVRETSCLPEAMLLERFRLSNTPEMAECFPLRMPPGGLDQPLPLLCKHAGLSEVTSPVLFAWGRNDAVQPFDALASFHRLPKQQSLVFDECGHWPYWEYPERFNEEVMKFLLEPR